MSESSHVLWLKNHAVEVGVVPGVGGRIVAIRHPGKKNVLMSYPQHWDQVDRLIPEITSSTDHLGSFFQGHICWVAPQSQWWSKQKQNAARASEKAPWPPDPFLTLAPYSLDWQHCDSVQMSSAASPIWGVSFTKTIRLEKNDEVLHSVEMKNQRDEAISWGIWQNCRLPSTSAPFVAVQDPSQVCHMAGEVPSQDWPMRQEYLSLSDLDAFNAAKPYAMKVGIHPLQQKLFGLSADKSQLLCIAFESTPVTALHPEHFPVEVFLARNLPDPAACILELEIQGPYTELLPGESVRHSIRFSIHQLTGHQDASDNAVIKMMRSL